jgi:hypothetical protein
MYTRLFGWARGDPAAPAWRMFRRSGHRFADKNMRQQINAGACSGPQERNMF